MQSQHRVVSHLSRCSLRLSARLYELTHNSTYLATAEQSIQFMHTYLAQPDNSISGAIDPTSCDINAGNANGDDIGFYIEGLSIVANVTANQTYTDMCASPFTVLRSGLCLNAYTRLNTLIPFIVTFPKWHTTGGILSIGMLQTCTTYADAQPFLRFKLVLKRCGSM